MKHEKLKAFLAPGTMTVVEAMEKIDANVRGILFVVDEKEQLLGAVTDGDIRRWLIRTGSLRDAISRFMNQNPRVICKKDLDNARKIMEKYHVTALPVVNGKGKVLDIVFYNDKSHVTEEKSQGLSQVPVVIMAGGKGTRLYPYTKILPKPLIPIGDVPIMERIIDRFRDYGVREFYATVNYRKAMIKSYFSEAEHNYALTYVEEDKPLGTAGSLRLIDADFQEPFLVTNCDILIRADYEDIYRYHKKAGNELTMVTALKNITVPYGVVHSSENGAVTSLEEKPKLSYFVNTGMYVVSPEALGEIPKDTFFHMTDLADALLKQGRPVGMYPISEESFLDMGEFEEMRRMENKLNLKSE